MRPHTLAFVWAGMACGLATAAHAAATPVYLEPVASPWRYEFDPESGGHGVRTMVTDSKRTSATLMGPPIIINNGQATNNQVLRYEGSATDVRSSTVAGELLGAGAVLLPTQTVGRETPFLTPLSPSHAVNARAQTGTAGAAPGQALSDFWTSRVETRTSRVGSLDADHTYRNEFQCGVASDPNGTVFCPTDPTTVRLGTSSSHEALAGSWWMDTWTPSADTTVTLSFRVHLKVGQVFGDPADSFLALSASQLTQQGFFGVGPLQDVRTFDRPDTQKLETGIGIWDLSARSPDQCADFPEVPPAVIDRGGCPEEVATSFLGSTLALRTLLEAGGTWEADLVLELSFLAQAGHDYRVVGGIDVWTQDGADLDGFNTFSLQNVALGNRGATLRSSAADAFGLRLPGTDDTGGGGPTGVPEPPTLALLLSVPALLLVRARKRQRRA